MMGVIVCAKIVIIYPTNMNTICVFDFRNDSKVLERFVRMIPFHQITDFHDSNSSSPERCFCLLGFSPVQQTSIIEGIVGTQTTMPNSPHRLLFTKSPTFIGYHFDLVSVSSVFIFATQNYRVAFFIKIQNNPNHFGLWITCKCNQITDFH